MNQQLLLQNTAELPPEAQKELFDFIDFLKFSYTQHGDGCVNDIDSEIKTQQILEVLRNIKPVKCEYSSEQIIQSLREGNPLA
ncbi:hypothetical protein [Candidatus Albibeggiatoa sp. nov. NOAA]|uniref:hypothetical protein n=1 Tax=Candidatus Albibeggiatoa sp. nov. NOAA TaxID=3162724 RepID=UPI0032F7B1C4|nr:DUF2281 domain-containing protein [Thiotrichaceae bacterium]